VRIKTLDAPVSGGVSGDISGSPEAQFKLNRVIHKIGSDKKINTKIEALWPWKIPAIGYFIG